MRKYNLTIAQLIDRLSIVTLKSIKIPGNKEEYEQLTAADRPYSSQMIRGRFKTCFGEMLAVNSLGYLLSRVLGKGF